MEELFQMVKEIHSMIMGNDKGELSDEEFAKMKPEDQDAQMEEEVLGGGKDGKY